MPDSCLGPVCEYVHLLSQWLKIHILPVAPLLTPLVATVAGLIAWYSNHDTRSTARKRAAIDFFLKTDMDTGMVAAHKSFQDALKNLADHERTGKSMDAFCKGEDGLYTTPYLAITGYLNIHELVAVGIKNKVFDKNVCYNFWSDALVHHAKLANKLIDFESSAVGWEASFLELRKLSVKWEKRNLKWQAKQRKKAKRQAPAPNPAPSAGQNPAPPSPQTTAANPPAPTT
jgi:hypothetical protein